MTNLIGTTLFYSGFAIGVCVVVLNLYYSSKAALFRSSSSETVSNGDKTKYLTKIKFWSRISGLLLIVGFVLIVVSHVGL